MACDPIPAKYELPQKVLGQTGDNPAWSQPDYNDAQWNPDYEGRKDSIFWFRMYFDFESDLVQNRHQGLFLFGFGSQEFYWDGTYIGSNGVPGIHPTEETPGQLTAYFLIPDSLAKAGRHILALRCSQQFEQNEDRFMHIIAADYFDLLRYPLIATSFMHILAGAYLLAAIYFLFLFISYRKEAAVLIFSVICFIFFLHILFEYLKFYVLYTYPWHYTRLEIINWMTILIAFLVPLFFGLQFKFIKLKWGFAGYLAVLSFFYFYLFGQHDNTAHMMGRCMWAASILIVSYGVYHSQKGAPLVLAGLFLSGVIDYFLIYDISLYVSFTLIILFMFYLLTVSGKEQREAYESSLLLSSRLKNELLKKHIQPHFIMNTLTSLIDWVEESPKEGVGFIEALAKEFDILSQVADHKLIPISQEIQLCKSHLTVMGYRKEILYQWEDHGIDPDEMIPPALIHTALENGITHSLPRSDGSIGFKLSFESTSEGKRYTLYTFGRSRSRQGKIEKGLGTKYMESRLKESYGQRWKLISETIPEGWSTQFIIYAV